MIRPALIRCCHVVVVLLCACSSPTEPAPAAAAPDSEMSSQTGAVPGEESAETSRRVEKTATGEEDDATALRAKCLAGPDFPACENLRSWTARELGGDAVAALAAEIAEAHPDHWVTHYHAGLQRFMRSDWDGARSAFESAVERAQTLGEPLGLAQGHHLLGGVALRLQDFSEAEVQFAAAGRAAGEAGELKAQSRSLYQLADVYRIQGRYEKQRDTLTFVIASNAGENLALIRVALVALAGAQRRLGRLGDALASYEQVVEYARGEDEPLVALALAGRCGVILDQGHFEDAAEDCLAAAVSAQSVPDANLELLSRGHAARAYARAGLTLETSNTLASFVDRIETLDPWYQLQVYVLAGDAERLSGNGERAETFYQAAQGLTAGLNEKELVWESSAGLASLYRSRRELDRAVAFATLAVEQVEGSRDIIDEYQDRTHFLQWRSEVYRVLAASLVEQDPNQLDRAFQTVERAHARTLAESLGFSSESANEPIQSLAEVRNKLEPGDLLVEFLLGEEESLLIAVTRDWAQLYSLPRRSEIDSMVERYREAILRPMTSVDARLDPRGDFGRVGVVGHELYGRLFQPILDRVASASRLIVIPDRKLHLLPFESLPVESVSGTGSVAFLGDRVSIRYLPAATFLSGKRPTTELKSVVVLSNDNAGGELGLAKLVHAASEASATVAAYGTDVARLLAGEQATLESLRAAAERPMDILHVVAHTVLQNGVGPRVLLAGPESETAYLDSHNVVALEHAPGLAVLSCCETAQGELVGGEGILGLVRAFTLAGTPTVVATLWMVDDETSAELMGRFHQALASGQAPAAALQQARKETLRGQFVHPFYWAPFVLYGAG